MAETNGFRITNKEIYEEVLRVRKELIAFRESFIVERARVDGLKTQVRLLWTLSFATVGAVSAAAFKVFTA